MGIFEKFKSGFKKSASAFTTGLRDIVIKKEIDDKNVISKDDVEKIIYTQKFNQMANTLISNLRKNTNIKFFNK